MKKIIITTAVIFFSMAGIADAAPDSNSIIRNGIEYYMQTDKAVYDLGENVEMLYRVTNLGVEDDVEFIFSYGPLDNTCDWMVDKDELRIWDNLGRPGTAVMTSFNLSPSESYEYTNTWDMTYKNGDNILPGNYNVTGVLGYPSSYERYVPVSVPIEIIPEPAKTYYVDASDGSDNNDGLSPQTAFATIQKAIDSAFDGDTVIVHPGWYEESVNFLGKNIRLTSTHPENPNAVAATVIEYGDGTEPAVVFRGTEDSNCMLAGFNIRGFIIGTDWSVDPNGENHTHATISHCIFQGICGACGGVIAFCDGTISNCLVVDNGYCICISHGPAVKGCTGLIKNCTIVSHTGVILVEPRSSLMVENCILEGNIWVGDEGTLGISHSNVIGGTDNIWLGPGSALNWGPGNINADPCFVREGYFVDLGGGTNRYIEGDYRLLETSPCIDAGDPNYIPEPNETDLDGNPRVIDGRIDMGAYETNYIQAAMKLTPQMLNCNSKGNFVKAHITLPEGFSPEDVDVNESAVAEPMGIESEYIKVIGNDDGLVRLEICFDREAFCEAITETGEVEITVIGSLTTSRYFYATDTIKIKPRR